jgi:hypothetical protein
VVCVRVHVLFDGCNQGWEKEVVLCVSKMRR